MFEPYSQPDKTDNWLALVIGNTRLHWGYFYQDCLSKTWHTPHLTQSSFYQLQQTPFQPDIWQTIAERSGPGTATNTTTHTTTVNEPGVTAAALSPTEISLSDIWIASAVPEQTDLWRIDSPLKSSEQPPGLLNQPADHLSVHVVERSHIPITNIYPTLGIDRAINLLGAGQVNGWPTVVIDGGTALTFTAGTAEAGKPKVYGGAILPGIRLQQESLAQKTAALKAHIPAEEKAPALPTRWAMNTKSAIASGLVYSLTATLTDYLTDWWQQFPEGNAIMTGGDAPLLHHYLQQRTPALAARVLVEDNLMFYGMQAYRQAITRP